MNRLIDKMEHRRLAMVEVELVRPARSLFERLLAPMPVGRRGGP